MQIMFEELDVKKLYIAQSTTLALFDSGRTSGIVVESGHDQTLVQPMIEGHPDLQAQ